MEKILYEEYWQLQEKPFQNTPNPRFLYHSPKHEEALSRMLYAVEGQKGGAMLTGEYGSGKTLLSRVLLEELNGDDYRVALILNPKLRPAQLIKEIVYQLGVSTAGTTQKADLLHSLNEILYVNKAADKKTVIVVDEAQAIGGQASFEELRLLLNFQLNEDFLLTLILIGQPELKEKVSELPQLRQRLAVRYHLSALDEAEVSEYIRYRLEVAGAKKEIFSDEACREVYACTEGIPRRINNICDMALLVGYGERLNLVDRETVRKVAEDLEENIESTRERVQRVKR